MSQRLNDYLASEAGEYLERMTRLLTGSAAPDPEELLRLARGIRGSARMAGSGPVAELAERLEQQVSALGRGGAGVQAAREACLRSVSGLEKLLRSLGSDVVPISSLFYDDEGPHVLSAPPLPTSPGEPVPIESLQYEGDAALARALELRPALSASVAGGDHAASAALIDEIFDLIGLARPQPA